MIKRKTLYVHMLQELVSPFALGLLIFTFILLMNRILKLMDLVVNKGIGVDDVIKLIIYLIPSFLILTIPMSLLLAVLIAFGRLSLDGETIAMKASGISLYQMLPPFITLGVFSFILTNMFTLALLPKGNHAFRSQLFNLSKRHSEANLEEKIFNDDFAGLVIYINEIPGHGKQLKGVLISDTRESDIPSLIIGEEGIIISDENSMTVTMRLFNGSIHRLPKDTLSYQQATFKTYDMNLYLSSEDAGEEDGIKYNEMDISTLITLVRERAKAKQSSLKIQTELHKRFAFPCACLVLGLVGVPLGAYRRRGSRSYGFILSIFVLFLYYLFLNFGEALAKQGLLAPFWGIWMPNIILSIIGIYLLRVVAREAPIPLLNWLEEKLGTLGKRLRRKLEKM